MPIGLGGLSLFPFIQVGFVVVMVSAVGIGLVFALGRRLGRRNAAMYVNSWVLILLIALIVNAGWAMATGQWQQFGAEIGWVVLLELLVFASMLVFILWFMAVRYAASIDD